ncbi:MAG: hypothetical protein JRI33_08080, partial [Deltaproteobacteria bacterium]|nr:hypothetical protein [Deltaproteobacteria bacterium]
PQAGAEALGDWLSDLRPGILSHHEREDGQGFPNNLAGPDIPLMAKIIAVADRFDILYLAHKPGKRPPLADVLLQIIRETGSRFNPEVVEALLRALMTGRLKIKNRPIGAGSRSYKTLAKHLADPGKKKISPRISPRVRKRFLTLIAEPTL